MSHWLTFVLLFFTLTIRDCVSKGGSRGKPGGSKPNLGGNKPNPAGNKPNTGGFKPGTGGTSIGGWGSKTFGRGSISGSSAKTLAAGLAGGYIGYKGAKIARKIAGSSSSLYYPSYHRTYYYGSRYYPSSVQTNGQTCYYQIESGDDYFDLTYEDTGSRVTEIIYNCNSGQNCCYGLDCCNAAIRKKSQIGFIFIFSVLILFLFAHRL